jgi:lipopolysaccharide export system protein LptC
MSAAEAARPSAMNWMPVSRVTFARALRHARRVRVWRLFCVSMAVVMGLAVVVSGVSRSLAPGFMREALPLAQAVRMINPRFTGRAGAQGSYVITAASAQRRPQNPAIIDLEAPAYRTDFGLTVSAPKGAYDPDTQTVELTGGVVFEDRKGNRFTTPRSTIDAKTNLARGPEPLQGAGPLGSVRADAYEIDTTSGHVRMTGGVSGTLSGSE